MQDSPVTDSPSNPLTALMQLTTVVDTIDSFIAALALEGGAHGGYFRRAEASTDTIQKARDLVYLRNSLSVSYELWQTDLRRRLLRSKGDFYIFQMTADETLSFTRRVIPGLSFAAESLRAQCQGWPLLGPHITLADILEKSARAACLYASQNKACLRLALDILKQDGENPAHLACLREDAVQPRALPRLPRPAA